MNFGLTLLDCSKDAHALSACRFARDSPPVLRHAFAWNRAHAKASASKLAAFVLAAIGCN